MIKRGAKEKEKILRRLTEKEIQEQLYGFRQTRVTPLPLKQKLPIEEKPAEQPKSEPKNPYIVVQVILLIIFLILIWVSVKHIIKIVSRGQYKVQTLQPKIKGVGRVKNGMERYR